MEWLTNQAEKIWQILDAQLDSPEFYLQAGAIVLAISLGWVAGAVILKRVLFFRTEPQEGPLRDLRLAMYRARALVQPISAAIVLGIAAGFSGALIGEAWLVKAAQGVAFVFVVYSIIQHLLQNPTMIFIVKWIGLPIALLYGVGWLEEVIRHLDSVSIEIGNIKVSVYAVMRTFVFGFVLFWLGRLSNSTGQRVIRMQATLDASTKEVAAKLFEIGVFVVIFLLLMNIMGIDLTALAVFGGALGVGLGFGLQQIATNFISGLIILLDRSLTIGDYIELEDGRTGTLRELTMRSATLETFDGKDIMVPNEKFITTAFTNWTHNNKLQRYPLTFQVAYKTDLEKLFEIVREVVASHPKVLNSDDHPIEMKPDAEIAGFADSGIDILVEFWMEGIDDGENRVGGDLLLMIWTALKTNGIEFPFPQREVKILNQESTPKPNE